MLYHDVQKISQVAINKSNFLKAHPRKYFLQSIVAGFFIVVAVIFSNATGSTFFPTYPEWGKLIGAFVFATAVLTISLVGGELFTGNNFVMAFAAYDKKVTWREVLRIWGVSYVGNFISCFFLTILFVVAGASGTSDYFATFIHDKLDIPYIQLFVRAILCNFFVCLAVLCTIKVQSETGKIIMVFLYIAGFVMSGFEHCIANMSTYTASYFLVPGLSLKTMFINMVVVTIGNIIGGAFLLAWPIRKMSMDE